MNVQSLAAQDVEEVTQPKRKRKRLFAARPQGDPGLPLQVAGVTKTWNKKLGPVLDAVSFTLEPGMLAWIGGHNGVGKTTLLRIAAGLIDADAGETLVHGVTRKRNRTSYSRAVGFLSAGDRGMYARLTGRDHLDYWARLAFVRRDERAARIDETIEQFALGDLVVKRVDRMSMGQRQRIRLAMTFLHRPSLVLLDEPSTSLDETGKELIDDAVARVRGRGGAVLWCSPTGDDERVDFDIRLVLDHGKLAHA